MNTTPPRRPANAPAYYRGLPALSWYAAMNRQRPAAGARIPPQPDARRAMRGEAAW